MKKIVRRIGAFILSAVGAVSGLITIGDALGIEMSGIFEWIAVNSIWILPISLFFCGMLLGAYIRNQQISKEIAELKDETAQTERHNKKLVEELAHQEALVKAMEKSGNSQRAEIEELRQEIADATEWKIEGKTLYLPTAHTNKSAHKQEQELRSRIMQLPDDFKAILLTAVIEQDVAISGQDQHIGESLAIDGLLEKLPVRKHFSSVWKATALAHRIIKESDSELWNSLQEGAKLTAESKHQQEMRTREKTFKDLSFDQKCFAYAVWKNGHYDELHWRMPEYDSGILEAEDIGDEMYRYTLKPEYEQLFQEREDVCFKAVKEYFANNNNES